MRFAYADPPYPGMARKFYKMPEVDHADLVADLERQFPDGWALSTGAVNLAAVVPLLPAKARICAWVKGWAPFHPSRGPRHCWEPVILVRGRDRELSDFPPRDWWLSNVSTGTGLRGSKPAGFGRWLASLLNAHPGDELVDVFPGTGVVSREFEAYCVQESFWTAVRRIS